jgi:exonuclease III
LPSVIDLRDLPWILKPIAWVYNKLFKKTTLININDNSISHDRLNKIKELFIKSDADIIGVQEDFNYHDEIYPSEIYNDSKHTGKIEISNLKWLPYPRFKADGLNFFTKKNISIFFEHLEKWEKCNGYIGHANDLLTYKGFRLYDVKIDDIRLDVYIVHMDADFYNPETCPDVSKDIAARKSQFEQLTNRIKSRCFSGIYNPIIIMGDTNCYNKYEWDKKLVKDFIDELNNVPQLHAEEAIPENYDDCDRIFYINHENGEYQLELKECNFDLTSSLSDHFPLSATFDTIKKR